MATVYSLGHSDRRLGELVAILKRYGIRVLVDVRSRPGSRVVPWFSKRSLERILPSHGVEYLWLGDLLGGLHEPFYPERLETMEYRRGIGVLASLIESLPGRVAFMCRERYWLNCHRAYIADTLHALGYTVIHIVELGRHEKHRPLGTAPRWAKPLS